MKQTHFTLYIIKYMAIFLLLGAIVYSGGRIDFISITAYISTFLLMAFLDYVNLKKSRAGEKAENSSCIKEVRDNNIEAAASKEALEFLSGNCEDNGSRLSDFIEKISSIRSELKMKNEELKALREASEIITSTFDVKVIIEYIYKVFNRFSGCDRYLIFFSDKDNNLVCRYEFGTIQLNETGNLVDKDSVIRKCFQNRQTIIKINTTINSRGITGDKIAIPLSVSGEIVGVIFMESSGPGAFSKVNVGFLESLAVYAAIAIKNAELFNSIFEQKQEIEALYEETAAVNEELSSYVDELNKTKEELKVKNEELSGFYNEIQTGYIQTVMALSNSIEAKDAYTRGHCQRVMEISCEIGKKLGLSDSEIQDLRYISILHDIGKIGIPANILNKEGKLTNEEFDEIKKHPFIAYNILKDVEFIRNGLDGILQHHERYDGKGYPYGRKGNEICKLGRILCIADAFDAMTSDRPYRKGMSMETAIAEIERCKGSQFDPHIADVFIAMSKQIIESETE
ncbi:MAG: HD domain-containing protein [Clostridia bacterium]|nr:HD domain-containing protein [Clostridia bacterium]